MGDERGIKSDFTDLIVWQRSHLLVVKTYLLVIEFPKFEQHGLADQMRRASVSITSNIAEGFGRRGPKEKIQFYHMSIGSLTELRNQIYVARDVGYIDKNVVKEVVSEMLEIERMLYGLIKTTKLRC